MIKELVWDSRLFGRKIGRLVKVPSDDVLKKLIRKAQQNHYRYLTCRVIAKKVLDVQVLEKNGFYMTDMGVVWERKTDATFGPAISVRVATTKDVPVLKRLSRGLFGDSRFYNDPFFTHDEAERLYQAWIEGSLRDKESKTFLAGDKGFIACKRLTRSKGDIPLIGVVSGEQGKGIGTGLVYNALQWFNETGVRTVTVRTQANNIKAMNFYKGLGFDVKYVDITMGKILTSEDIP